MRLATTNGDLIKTHRGLLVRLAASRLERLASVSYGDLCGMTAEALVRGGYADPIRIFVKNELHSDLKVSQGRMRLIMSVSVVDQLVERVLNGPQNQAEIATWQTIFSKPGMGLDDEGLASLTDQISMMGQAQSSDVTGFDWCVSQGWLDFDAKAREIASGDHRQLHLKRAFCLGMSVVVFSDGVVWAQTEPGVQKSGSYNTSSTNSRIRAALAHLVAWRAGVEPAVIAMGDDAVERRSDPDPVTAYGRLGFALKEVSTSKIEFCAYHFGADGWFPVRWHKMLANMLWTKPRDAAHATELLVALSYELRHAPAELRLAQQLITTLRWGVEISE